MQKAGWRCRTRSGAGQCIVRGLSCIAVVVLVLAGSVPAQQIPVDPCSSGTLLLRCVNGQWLSTDMNSYIRRTIAIYDRFGPLTGGPLSNSSAVTAEVNDACASLQNIAVCMLQANKLCYRGTSLFRKCAKSLNISFRADDVVPVRNATRMSFLLNNFSLPGSSALEEFRLHNEDSSVGGDDSSNIQALITTIIGAKSLVLSLSGFSLPKLDLDMFQTLVAVTDLSLSNNRISFINSSVLASYSSASEAPNSMLKRVDLSGNLLTSIPDHFFYPLPNVETLELSRNQLTSFSPTLVHRAVRSFKINIFLNGNNLTWMNTNTLVDNSKVDGVLATSLEEPVLHLHDNPWNCTCDLWSVRWLLKLQHPTDMRVTCANLNNRPLLTVTYEELCPSGISLWTPDIATPADTGRMTGRPYLVRNDRMLLACTSESSVVAHLLCYAAGLAPYHPANQTLRSRLLLNPVLLRHVQFLDVEACDNSSVSLRQCQEHVRGCNIGTAFLQCRSATATEAPTVYPESVQDGNDTGLIRWKPLLTEEWRSPPGGYTVLYRDAHNAHASGFSVEVPANSSSLRLPSSLPGRSYRVAVKPRTGVNDRYYALDSFQPLTWLPQAPVTPRITSFVVDAGNLLTVSWAGLSTSDWNGLPGVYHVKLCLVNGSACNELNRTAVRQSPLETVFDLNAVTRNSSDHRRFRVGVRATSFDVTRRNRSRSHTHYEDVWSKPNAPVENMWSQRAAQGGIVLSWTYALAQDDPELFFHVVACTSSACASERLNGSNTTYTLASDAAGLVAVRNVTVRPCTGPGLSLCGTPGTYRWRRQSVSPSVLEDDGTGLSNVDGAYQYQWTVNLSDIAENITDWGDVLAIDIEYSPQPRTSSGQQSKVLGENATAVLLSTATGELRFGTKHELSYVVFSADPSVETQRYRGDRVMRSTEQLSPRAPADWSVDGSSDVVRLRLPAINVQGEFYQIVSMPIQGDGVPLRQQIKPGGKAGGRTRRQANSSSASPGVSADVENLTLGVMYEIWVQQCVALDAAPGVACGAFSDKKLVAIGTTQPSTPATSPPPTTGTIGGGGGTGPGPGPGGSGNSDSLFSTTSGVALIVGVCCTACILALVVCLINLHKSRRWRKESMGPTSPMSPYDRTELIRANGHAIMQPTTLDPKVAIISEDQLSFTEMLGRGEFGNVHKGMYKFQNGRVQVVAAKVLKDVASVGDREALMEEIVLMSRIAEKGSHENVIEMVVGGRYRGRPCMVMEYMDVGDLHSYLERNRLSSDHKLANHAVLCTNLTSRDLLLLAIQVARGMEHLSVEVQVVHRDLAARNVLIQSAGGNQFNLKIADFGLARSIYKREHYKRSKGTRVPLKWLAIESLREDLYSCASDVWSFGILMWEIVTLGGHPYPGIPFDRLCYFLESGYRMPRPKYCSRELYSMMRRCWESDPTLRPSFTELVDQLDILLSTDAGYITVDPNLNAAECDTVDEVSESDSDADSPAQRWPTELFGEMTPGFAMTPDGYLRPRDSNAPNQFSFDDDTVAQVNGDVRAKDANGGDVEAATDGPSGSAPASRRGSRRGLSSRRQSSVKSNHRASMVQGFLPSLQRMLTSAAGSIFRAGSTESLDRGLSKTQQLSSDGTATTTAAPPSSAAARGARRSRQLQRRHSSSDVPSDDSSAATLTDFHRRSSSEGHPDSVDRDERQPPTTVVARSVSNASGRPATVVSRMHWPHTLTEQRQSVEYATNAPPVAGSKPPLQLQPPPPAKASPQLPAKPQLPPKPPHLVIKPPANSSSPQVPRRQPDAAKPVYMQPSPFASTESMSKVSGSRESLGDVFDSKSGSVESVSFVAAPPLAQSYPTGRPAGPGDLLPSSVA